MSFDFDIYGFKLLGALKTIIPIHTYTFSFFVVTKTIKEPLSAAVEN